MNNEKIQKYMKKKGSNLQAREEFSREGGWGEFRIFGQILYP